MESKTAPPPYLIEAAARARAARKLNQLRRWAEEMRAAGWTVLEPDGSGPLPLSTGRIQAYCGRVERPHTGHVWTTETGRWCPGDETR